MNRNEPDLDAETYDVWYHTPLGALSDGLEKAAVFALIEVRPSMHVLDLSCGTGNYVLEFVSRGAQVVGLDTSLGMLKAARHKATQKTLRIHLVCADASDLPFRGGTFDLVSNILGLEFVSSPDTIIREIARVLQPHGRFVIGALNRFSLWAFKRRIKGWFDRSSIWRKATFLTQTRLANVLIEAGFVDLQQRRAIYFPPINRSLFLQYARLIERVGRKALPWSAAFIVVSGRLRKT
jgi:ubiquinone/menaquinone biosynthesis C-methylase UbiE